MKRRLNSRCRGLLEIGASHDDKGEITVWNTRDLDKLLQRSDFEDPAMLDKLAEYGRALADCHVQYLHKSVKDYLQEPEVWAAILHATRSVANPGAALCISYLHQMKTMELGKAMATERVEFLRLLAVFFESVASLPSYNEELYIEMVDLLDQTASSVASAPCYNAATTSLVEKVWGSPNCHWVSITNGAKQTDTLLTFAVRHNFLTFLRSKLQDSALDVMALSALLYTAVSPRAMANKGVRSSDEDMATATTTAATQPSGPNLAIIRLLLSHGANPDMKTGSESSTQCVWQRLRQTDRENTKLYDSLEGVMTLFKDWARHKYSIGKLGTQAKRVFRS